jgi:hypothetical protein
VELDPRNADVIGILGETYLGLRKYEEALAMSDRALALEPRGAFLRAVPAWIGVEADANVAPLRATLDTIEAESASSAAEVARPSFYLALRERDPYRGGPCAGEDSQRRRGRRWLPISACLV